MRFATLTDVKATLSAVVDEVNDDHEPVLVTRHGQPIVAIVPIADFDRLYGAVRIIPETEQ